MGRTLALFVIGLVFGGGLGFAFAAGNGITFDGHDHGDAAQHGGMDHGGMTVGGMDHAKMHETPIAVPADAAPEVQIMISPDPMAGYNLHVMVENFEFSPQNASLPHQPGQGHAHVYANGVKLARIYGPWMHLDGLPKGQVEIEVTLNSNDHHPLEVEGTPVTARAVVEVE
ncbi:hypothetical protein O4H53_20730 [Sulfitobacter sp. G21635-S1]|uniref:hypothetical protein n=1 Tax=Sulfitobacter sp. G21635-S1 TaxID=3014043 RepID=UPI0022AFF841|nr:hypothetical protein [Sulfitobacter sp. G21635-S1]MCZ4257981.1 hypothetical protein [Sulfitobacter sp. G21635-S1]